MPLSRRFRRLLPSAALLIWLALPVEAGAGCGLLDPLALGDFDGDGRRDLVVGSPRSSVNEHSVGGVVHVLYRFGIGAGLLAIPQQTWHLEADEVPGIAYPGARFGRSLAVGDFDCNGVDDLAIGEKDAVTVLFGSVPDGLTTAGVVRLTGPLDSQFGSALAAGDFFDPLGCDDLAVGAPRHSGAVYVFASQPAAGPLPDSVEVITQNTPGVPGSSEGEDAFGEVLTAGRLDDDPYTDLVVGVPGEDLGSYDEHGAVNVLYGGGDGFDLKRSQIWHQEVPFVVGESEFNDRFGDALDTGDVDGDGRIELIVGVPGEGDENAPFLLSDNISGSGAINVIPGSPSGLAVDGDHLARIWSQDSDGIQGINEPYDYFGSSVALGDFDGDGYEDVSVGAPWEDREGFAIDGGLVHVLRGSPAGLTADGDYLVHQNTAGEWVAGSIQVDGDLQDFDRFGCAQVAGLVNNDEFDDLVVTSRAGTDSAVNVVFGSPTGLTADKHDYWVCAGLDGCSLMQGTLNQPSQFAPVTDGIATDPPGRGEWSDVLPLAFTLAGAAPVAVDPDDIETTDFAFFASLGPEPDPQVAHLNVLLQLPLRTDPSLAWQDPVATIRFPATLPGAPDRRIIGVHLLGAGPGVPAWPPDAWLDLDGNGEPDDSTGGSEPNVPASGLGIEVAAGFAGSSYEASPHLQIELRVPLSIPDEFPDPTGPLADVPDGPGGIYRPNPGLWTVEYRPEPHAVLEPAGSAVLEIDPRGVLAGSSERSIQRLVDLALLDDLGDGDGEVRLAILSKGTFVATDVAQHVLSNARDPARVARPTLISAEDTQGDGDVDQVLHFSSAELLSGLVVSKHSTDIVLTGETPSGTVAGHLGGLTVPRVAAVPDGAGTPGTPLEVKRTGNPENIKLSWGAPCGPTGVDYAVYRGTLGDFASHRPVACTTGGATTTNIPMGPDDHYYLVVPIHPDGVEGSYGVSVGGGERPQGVPTREDPPGPVACAVQSVVPVCEP